MQQTYESIEDVVSVLDDGGGEEEVASAVVAAAATDLGTKTGAFTACAVSVPTTGDSTGDAGLS